jgi:hypothetical protein
MGLCSAWVAMSSRKMRHWWVRLKFMLSLSTLFIIHNCLSVLLLFLVLNFPLDFVVPLDVEVIGLNPLFGVNASLSDQFISHALIFRPRLVVLNYHLTTNKDVCLTNHTLQTHLLSPDCRVSEVVSWSIELLQCSSCDFFSFVPNGELLHCIEIPS